MTTSSKSFTLLLGTLLIASSCSSRQSGPEYGEFTNRRTPSNVVTAEQIADYPSVGTVEELLVRLVPSVEFAGGGLQIRGLSGRPLWVIDGVPLDLNTGAVPVNPRDVQRIEVVRDGGATAAYGFRGANGVIVIRTRG